MTTTYDNRVLPTGGSRIPPGMEDHSNWQSLPEQPVQSLPSSHYGPEYVEAETTRTHLNELKKAISAVLPPIAAIDKNEALAEVSGEEKKAEVMRLNEKEEKRRDESIEALRGHHANFPSGTRWGDVIDEVVDRAGQRMNKDDFIKFNDYIKVQTTTIFREHGNLLQKMKEIKKRKQ